MGSKRGKGMGNGEDACSPDMLKRVSLLECLGDHGRDLGGGQRPHQWRVCEVALQAEETSREASLLDRVARLGSILGRRSHAFARRDRMPGSAGVTARLLLLRLKPGVLKCKRLTVKSECRSVPRSRLRAVELRQGRKRQAGKFPHGAGAE